MKGDHLFEEVKLKPNPTHHNTMFSKLHPHPHPHSPSLLPHHPHTQYHLQLTHESEEEDNSQNSVGATAEQVEVAGPFGGGGGGGSSIGVGSNIKKIKTSTEQVYSGGSGGVGGGGASGFGDGASIEISRKPRGRPPGSKNKPKPPIIITRDTECAMRPHILEISTGLDIIESLSRFVRQRNVGLCVLTASGTVVNVSLRQPSTTPGATVTFHGRFDILSISATYLPPTSSVPASNGCSISLAGPQGQIFGGSVVGGLIAASNVFIVATSFTNPTYHRLPNNNDDNDQDVTHNTSDQNQVATPISAVGNAGGGAESHSAQTDSGGGGMSIYSCHLPSDVIWAPTPRQPAPSSPHY
ncbi:hypothetical protein IFM89_036247 [Coptis chinensis]|uniref:PPC domain-containing protein n=1 Tax=Coptis chinensis TaxID=261450 RepID=A0A835HRV0_9MAGN|nr:hypothetical protein IFM89_036247 [Coptis chinensis]